MKDIPQSYDIPLDRSIWCSDEVSELRAMLKEDEVLYLYQKLSSQPYDQWMSWFITNIKVITTYASGDRQFREKIKCENVEKWLLIHHASMYQLGLLLIAKSKGYPLNTESRSVQQSHDLCCLSYSIMVWEDLTEQCKNHIFWLFDSPAVDTTFPFADIN